MSGDNLAQIVFAITFSLLVCIGLSAYWQNDGFDLGYRQGFANAKAGICNKRYFSCKDEDSKPTKHD